MPDLMREAEILVGAVPCHDCQSVSGPDNDNDGLVAVEVNTKEVIARCNSCDLLQSVPWGRPTPVDGGQTK